jgi:adenosylhomocysteine nucleosidase
MDSVGLIAAIKQECAAVFRHTGRWKKILIGSLPGYQREVSGKPCILVVSGMGEARASATALELIERANVRSIISFGIAGAVEESLDIGDVILVDQAFKLENSLPGAGMPLHHWSDAAFTTVGKMLIKQGTQLFRGSAVTTSGAQVAREQLKDIEHPVLEMETAGIAQITLERHVPFLAVRAISDGPVAPIPFDLGEMMDENANLRVGKLLKQIMLHPKMIGELRKMIKNNRIAAERAAFTLVELLHFPIGEVV